MNIKLQGIYDDIDRCNNVISISFHGLLLVIFAFVGMSKWHMNL